MVKSSLKEPLQHIFVTVLSYSADNVKKQKLIPTSGESAIDTFPINFGNATPYHKTTNICDFFLLISHLFILKYLWFGQMWHNVKSTFTFQLQRDHLYLDRLASL